MTATTAPTRTGIDSLPPATRLLGLGNLLRKDLGTWRHGRRLWVVAGITTTVFVLAAANARIIQWILSVSSEPVDASVTVPSLVPGDAFLQAIATQFPVLAVIFASMSLLIMERESGTLAWTVSKPVARTSVLVSLWLSATVALWIGAIVVPIAITTGVVAVLYGMPDVPAIVALALASITVPAIFVGIALAASTVVTSQAVVGAVGLFAFVLPSIVGGILPVVAPFFPTSIFGWATEATLGGQVSVVTPVAWALGMAGLFLLARHRLAGMEL